MAFPPTMALSRSLSTQVMRARCFTGDTWVDDDVEVWILAEVVHQDNTLLTVRRKSNGEDIEVDLGFGEAHTANPKVVSDMTSLHHIHEAGILYNLAERSKVESQRPYTFMGTILIAVNPLRRIPNPDVSEYMDRALNPEAPHPYAIAELAYHQMRLGAGRKAANQSIVVSGESGAGKTETSKIILTFLTHRSAGGVTNLDQKVLDSSPILESFGNAKTLRNNNSSRFGKFLKLQFTKDKHRLAGAFIETYLLEKSRVLTPGVGERNFHVLYQLVAGASDLGLDLKLEGVGSYKILSRGDCITLDGVDDAKEFKGVRAAFDTIGMGEESQLQVWQMLAAMLHLSNLEFSVLDHQQGEITTISDNETLSTLARLLGVEEEALRTMLTQRVIATRGEIFTIQVGLDDASLVRDAIVKSLYEALFLWVVSVINNSLGKGEDSLPFIGVLDIFGFENFDTKNEFEQLLINFTNESLQDTFNKQVFSNELRLYEEEGIDVVVSTCPDNADCLKMLSGKPGGIIPRLDNICAEPNPSDARYLDGLHKAYLRHQDFPQTSQRDMRENFWVKHYAGKVKYTVHGWVERNMDRVPESFSTTLATSKHRVVQEATSKYRGGAASTATKAKTARARKTLTKPTVGKAFLASMQDLNLTLLSTTCNFIRCIKPNAAMQCGVFSNRYVVDQLQCLGILQTCEVLKVGMPTRVTYTELKEVLGDNAAEAEKLFAGEPETALIAAILWAFEVPLEVFRLGRTRVFFRAGQISTLQKILNETGPEKGPWIFGRLQEALANRHKAKAAADEAKAAVKSAQSAVREAEEETTKAIGADKEEQDEEDDGGLPARLSPKSVLSSDDEYLLESALKKARKAGACVSQVEQFVQAAREDGVGTFAAGALERLLAASKEALQSINASSAAADEVEGATQKAKGGDAAGEIRRIEGSLERLRDEFRETKNLAVSSDEAAAKCQVEKAQEFTEQAKRKASAVSSQAAAVTGDAREFARAAERQTEALQRAKALLPKVTSATEEALAAFSAFKTTVKESSAAEEAAAREASDKAEAEAKNAAAAAAEAAAAAAAAETARLEAEEAAKAKAGLEALSIKQSNTGGKDDDDDDDDDMSNLPSEAPKSGSRSRLMQKMPSRSVQDLLDTTVTPSMSVSPKPEPKDDLGGSLKNLAVAKPGSSRTIGRKGSTSSSVSTASVSSRLAFETKFNEAAVAGRMEGYLMKQSKHSSRWKSQFFRLDDGFLTCYDMKSLVGTTPNKEMELTGHSTASFATTKNCFCVRTGDAAWFLMARDLASMTEWMTAINAEIHRLFVKLYDVPEDNYWSQGVQCRFFYRMVAGARPQWILTYPEEAAPRTGDGLFEGDAIDVVQV
ncbi:unnamed protein product, partial [Ectocarpus fasciculatus]